MSGTQRLSSLLRRALRPPYGRATYAQTALRVSPSQRAAVSLSAPAASERARGGSWTWWRCCAGFMSGLGTGLLLLGSGSVVLCRPFDTPSYLIPYYLRDVRSRFQHYASVRKRKDGPSYMNVDDFVLALLASPETELKDPSIAADLKDLFNTFDANGDGYISFPEFRFLLSLITSQAEDMKALFKIVDEDEVGSVSLDQFADVLRGLTNDEAAVHSLLKKRRNGVLLRLFGDDSNPRRCTYEALAALVHSIRVEVWKAEFRTCDTSRRGSISAEQFAELISSQLLGVHVPYYIVENIRKLRQSQAGDGKEDNLDVPLDDWIFFHELMLCGDKLAESVELYCASGQLMNKDGFGRVLQVSGLALPGVAVDILFAVFDKDGDGTIEVDEFMYVMKQKINHHYSSATRDKKALSTRLVECSASALSAA